MTRQIRTLLIVAIAVCFTFPEHVFSQCNPTAAEIPNNGFDEDCDGLDDIFLVLPPHIYGVVGQDMEIYFRNLILSKHPQDYLFSVNSPLSGTISTQKWHFVPTQAGEFPLSVSVQSNNGQNLATATTTVRISPSTLPTDASAKKLLLFGHSFFDQGYMPKYIFDLLQQPNNPPVTFHGKKASWANSLARHEGYGGMMARWFFNDPASPIRYGNKINFRQYFNETICASCAPDWIVFHLDINDFCGYSALAGLTLQEIDDSIVGDWNRHATRLIDSMRVAAPNAKIAICISPPPNARESAFAITYGSNPILNNRWRWQKIINRLIFKNIERYGNREHQNIFLIPEFLDIDDFSEYNPPDARHPDPPDNNINTHCGYNEIAKTIYAWLKWVQHHPNHSQPQPFMVFRDADADGYGNPFVKTLVTTIPTGFVLNNLDCDDTNPARHPQAIEICNQIDDNCDGVVDEETIPPTAKCQPLVIAKTAINGIATINPAQIDAGSTDNCHPITFSLSQNTFSCQHVGQTFPVTLTVRDAVGNQATCQSHLKIEDGTPPVAKCFDTKIVKLSANGIAPIYNWEINNGSWDACTDIHFAIDRSQITCDDLPSTSVRLTVTDASGNTSTCQTQVLVKDETPPLAKCHPQTSIILNENGVAMLSPQILDSGSSDACSHQLTFEVLPQQFDCSKLGNQTVQLTVQDGSGNTSSCQSLLKIEDKTPPELAALTTTTIKIDLSAIGEAQIDALPLFDFSDNCTISAWQHSFDGHVFESGSIIHFDCSQHPINEKIPVFFRILDASGNFSIVQSLQFQLQDTTPPRVICHEIEIFLENQGSVTIPHEVLVGNIIDKCSAATWLTAADQHFTCADVEKTYFFEQTAIDAAGNLSKCHSIVHIQSALDFDGDGVDDCHDECPTHPETAVLTPFYEDFDSDGFGNDLANPLLACEMPPHFATIGGDCDDSNPEIHPLATEILNEMDDNCNGEVDEGLVSVLKIDQNSNFQLYPNPTNGDVWLAWQLPSGIFFEKIILHDLTGRQIVFQNIAQQSAGKQNIDLLELPSGCYFLKILFQNGNQTTLRLQKI